MAIPTDLFSTSAGIALMRYDNALAEWFFVGWVVGKATFIEELGAGTHTFQLWLVIGRDQSVGSVGHAAWSAVAAFRLRR